MERAGGCSRHAAVSEATVAVEVALASASAMALIKVSLALSEATEAFEAAVASASAMESMESAEAAAREGAAHRRRQACDLASAARLLDAIGAVNVDGPTAANVACATSVQH